MPIHANMYMHEMDKSTLQTLKAIPGFTPLYKAYMKLAAEQQYHIQNMSMNLRLGEDQLPEYYNMLPPICAKLGIKVPELYLSLEDTPNAYTFGDTNPFIVITSGLLEIMPHELLPTILAHECGHIACHHTLYRNLGISILNGAGGFLGLTDLASAPIQAAFYHWIRCSEFSADRAAAICDGTCEKVMEMCLRFSGFGGRTMSQINMDAFMAQAADYSRLMAESKWNQALGFMMFYQSTHPQPVVRASEINLWQNSPDCHNILAYLDQAQDHCLPLPEPAKHYIGQPLEAVRLQMQYIGFSNILLNRLQTASKLTKPGQVTGICIDGRENFPRGGWYPQDTQVVISYYEPLSYEELAAAHPGEICMPEQPKRYLGRPFQQVANELQDAGFRNIIPEACAANTMGWVAKPGSVVRITIGGQTQFDKGSWFSPDAVVRIYYSGYEPYLPGANT